MDGVNYVINKNASRICLVKHAYTIWKRLLFEGVIVLTRKKYILRPNRGPTSLQFGSDPQNKLMVFAL